MPPSNGQYRAREAGCSVAGPESGGLLERLEAAAVQGRLDGAGHRPLEGSGREDLLPAVVGLSRLGNLLLAGEALPQLLEEGAGGDAPGHAEHHAERAIQEFAHGYFLLLISQ